MHNASGKIFENDNNLASNFNDLRIVHRQTHHSTNPVTRNTFRNLNVPSTAQRTEQTESSSTQYVPEFQRTGYSTANGANRKVQIEYK